MLRKLFTFNRFTRRYCESPPTTNGFNYEKLNNDLLFCKYYSVINSLFLSYLCVHTWYSERCLCNTSSLQSGKSSIFPSITMDKNGISIN